VLPPYWLSRLVIATWAGHLPLVTWLTPESMSGRAIAASGAIAGLFLLVLAFTSIVAIVDVCINDLLPDRWQLPVIQFRHVGFMGMALSLLMLAGVVGIRHGVTALLLSYLLPAFFAVLVTWMDIFVRHQRRLARRLAA
jgi:hypothetical protein